MKFLNLCRSTPQDNSQIVVLYEDNAGNLSTKFYKYDGFLTYEPEIKGNIYWAYVENIDLQIPNQPERLSEKTLCLKCKDATV